MGERAWLGRAAVVMTAVVFALAPVAGCDRGTPAASDSLAAAPTAEDSDVRSLATVPVSRNGATVGAPAVEPATRNGGEPTILFIGTSLTAGYGLDPADAFPAVVGRMLDSAGHPAHIVNAGVSGETSADLRSRIDWVLRQPADIIIVETGANDGLRGLSVGAARDNIQAILDRIRAKQPSARVMLVQMEALPNLGASYTAAFHAMYPDLARKNNVELVPFLLEGVAGINGLNQDDGIHPNRAGARIVARTVYTALLKRPLLTTATH